MHLTTDSVIQVVFWLGVLLAAWQAIRVFWIYLSGETVEQYIATLEEKIVENTRMMHEMKELGSPEHRRTKHFAFAVTLAIQAICFGVIAWLWKEDGSTVWAKLGVAAVVLAMAANCIRHFMVIRRDKEAYEARKEWVDMKVAKATQRDLAARASGNCIQGK